MAVRCFSCQTVNQTVDNKVGFRDDCESCGTDLHCCKCCRFYDTGAYNECRESSADIVREKERANYCEYFQPNEQGSAADDQDKLRAAADALFKK